MLRNAINCEGVYSPNDEPGRNEKGIIIRKKENKERCGYRGKKLRYSVWKAEYNNKWEKRDEETVHKTCLKYGLDPETFIVRSDPERDMWTNASRRLVKYLKTNHYFRGTDKGDKTEQIRRTANK